MNDDDVPPGHIRLQVREREPRFAVFPEAWEDVIKDRERFGTDGEFPRPGSPHRDPLTAEPLRDASGELIRYDFEVEKANPDDDPRDGNTMIGVVTGISRYSGEKIVQWANRTRAGVWMDRMEAGNHWSEPLPGEAYASQSEDDEPRSSYDGSPPASPYRPAVSSPASPVPVLRDDDGLRAGTGLPKRHQKRKSALLGITKPSIRRLARRGGVKRISGVIYQSARSVLKQFLENVIRDTVTYTEYSGRKTVTASDVLFALKRQGRTLYGF